MKRIIVLIIALTVVLAACSAEGTPEDEGESTGSTVSVESVSDSTVPSEKVTATTVVEDGVAGTMEDPVPGGEFTLVGDWSVRVVEVMSDATELVMSENDFNDPPAEGNQFFVAALEAEYVGSESGTFWIDMIWKALGPSAVAYEAIGADCGVIPDAIADAGEAFPGGVITGNMCWEVTSGDAADLLMLLEETFSLSGEGRRVFDLDSEMAPVELLGDASVDLSGIPAVDIGETSDIGDWSVRVVEVMSDATELVMSENDFNDPPAEGNQFFVAALEAEYVGSESGTFWIDMIWKALGPSAVAYEAIGADCGVIPDAIADAGETFPGGVITGNVCWAVSSDDAADLLMLAEETFSLDDDGRVFYRLSGGG